MMVTSLVTGCCGMASHSSTSICRKSAILVVWVTSGMNTDPATVQWGFNGEFNGVEVRNAGGPFHPLHSLINPALWRRALSSWRIEFGPRLWRYGIARISYRYRSALRLPTITMSLVFPVREMPPHTINTASTKRCYSIDAAISIAFSVSSPHIDPTIQTP